MRHSSNGLKIVFGFRSLWVVGLLNQCLRLGLEQVMGHGFEWVVSLGLFLVVNGVVFYGQWWQRFGLWAGGLGGTY